MGQGERFHSWSLGFSSADAGHDEPMRLIRCDNQNRFSFVSAVSLPQRYLGFGHWLRFHRYRHSPLLFCVQIITWYFKLKWWKRIPCLKFDGSLEPAFLSPVGAARVGPSTWHRHCSSLSTSAWSCSKAVSGAGTHIPWPMWGLAAHLALNVGTEN